MITKEQQIELWKEFKKLKTDEERWRFITGVVRRAEDSKSLIKRRYRTYRSAGRV